jgi:competence protein ComEA
MDTEMKRRVRAALVLASVLFALALARPAPPGADCEAPGERRAVAGHSVELACASPVLGRPVRGPARRLVGLPIDPNDADAATLETLPGVGPARALAILEARERRPFRRVADLERVPGIGPRTLAGMAAALAIREPSPPPGRSQAKRAARRSRAEAEARALPAP